MILGRPGPVRNIGEQCVYCTLRQACATWSIQHLVRRMLIRVRGNEAIRPTHFKHSIHTNIIMWIYDLATSPACLLQWQEAGIEPAATIKAGIVQIRGLGIVTYGAN